MGGSLMFSTPELRCAGCGGKGTILVNQNAGDWDDPYACNYCEAHRLPEHLRHPEKQKGYVPYAPKPKFWDRVKQVFNP